MPVSSLSSTAPTHKVDQTVPMLQSNWCCYSLQLIFLYHNNPPFWGGKEAEWDGRRNWSKTPQQNQKKNTIFIKHILQTCRSPNDSARNKRYLETQDCTPKKWEFSLARVNRNIQCEDIQMPHKAKPKYNHIPRRTMHKCPFCLLYPLSSDGLY